MSINIILEIKSNSTRVFKLSKQNRDIINKKFNKLQR